MQLLIDADAYLCLRKWGLLQLLLRMAGKVTIVLAGYVAHHELNDIQSELEEHQKSGTISVQDVKARTQAYRHFRELQNKGADKGEAESIAWANGLPKASRPLFVSQDVHARRLARENGLEAVDMFDLAIHLHAFGLVEKSEVQSLLASWDDNPHLACQPSDFAKFDETWSRHLSARRQRARAR